jgi:hypothetical protein
MLVALSREHDREPLLTLQRLIELEHHALRSRLPMPENATNAGKTGRSAQPHQA